ncbi:MAG: AAA family ATPase [Gaiella sp.]
MLAVLVTGPPGSGKTTTLTALSDALVEDGIYHACVDVDEIAWAYPFPDLVQRCEHLRAWRESHARAGATLVVVAEVIGSASQLDDVLAALGADDHLLVRLDASAATLRARIVAREPDGWLGLDRLLAEATRLQASMASLDLADLVLDTERSTVAAVTESVRTARSDVLRRTSAVDAEGSLP